MHSAISTVASAKPGYQGVGKCQEVPGIKALDPERELHKLPERMEVVVPGIPTLQCMQTIARRQVVAPTESPIVALNSALLQI